MRPIKRHAYNLGRRDMSQPFAMTQVVIIGAGVIGLYTALILSRSGDYRIKVIAKHMPGDISIEYTSPFAGGNFSGISGDDDDALEFDRVSYKYLNQLVREYGLEAGLEKLPIYEFGTDAPNDKKLASLREYVEDFEFITDKAELTKRGAQFGYKFTTFNFNSPFFIKWLYNHLSGLGVEFQKRALNSLDEAITPETQVVFNCSGVTASKLTGDPDTYPIRGQVVVVRAPHVRCNMGNLDHHGPPTYIIPRPNSGGRVVLGGFYQAGNWTAETFGTATKSILDRTVRLMPELLDHGPLEIIEERAGLRPGRKGGPRIELDSIKGVPVVHNYGAAGTGYQSGIGMCMRAIRLWLPQPRL